MWVFYKKNCYNVEICVRFDPYVCDMKNIEKSFPFTRVEESSKNKLPLCHHDKKVAVKGILTNYKTLN